MADQALLAAASAALGAALTEPADLGGSERSSVLRCRSSDGGTVVVKTYPLTREGADGYAAEAAGLTFTAGLGMGPELLAADPAARLIVMSDLGDAPSLADLLLGTSAADARAQLLRWTRACGDLAARTAGRQREMADLLAAHQVLDPGAGEEPASDGPARHWLDQRINQIPGLLAELSTEVPAGLADDLAGISSLLFSGRWALFSPGDICPDNNLLTAGGVRFIDFESAEFHSAFLDAAYLRMPFSSCWCVFRLPEDLAGLAEAEYRNLAGAVYPELAREDIWRPGVRAAMAAWTLHALTYLLDRSMIADGAMSGRTAPTARQLLRYRWQRLLDELEPAAEFPAIARLMTTLLDSTRHWNVPDLPLYPAFS